MNTQQRIAGLLDDLLDVVAHPVRRTQLCSHCGAEFVSARVTAKFCSSRCRLRAHRGLAREPSAVWLRRAAEALTKDIIEPAGISIDLRGVDFAFGWTAEGARPRGEGMTAGSTVMDSPCGESITGGSTCKADRVFIMVTRDGLAVLGCLLHELLHVAFPGCGHRGPFAPAARAVGLEGPPTRTEPSSALDSRLRAILRRIGAPPVPEMRPIPVVIEKDDVWVKNPALGCWVPPKRP